MSFTTLLNKTCTIQSLTASQDSAGQMINTWANTYTNVRCRLDGAEGKEVFGEDTIKLRITHVLFIDKQYVIASAMRVIVSGITYNILAVTNAGGHDHHQELLLERQV